MFLETLLISANDNLQYRIINEELLGCISSVKEFAMVNVTVDRLPDLFHNNIN